MRIIPFDPQSHHEVDKASGFIPFLQMKKLRLQGEVK